MYRSVSAVSIVRFSEDGGTDFSGESFSGTNRAVLRESFPFFEPKEPPVSESFRAFRFDREGPGSAISSSESMIITSAGFDRVGIGFDWAAEPKKERKVAVFPTGVVFSCFGLWERGMKQVMMVGTAENSVGNGALGHFLSAGGSAQIAGGSTWLEVELSTST